MCRETRDSTKNRLYRIPEPIYRLWRAFFALILYVAGTNITEALLFSPTLLLLLVPSFVLEFLRTSLISLVAIFYGSKGRYITADGRQFPYSLNSYYNDLDFRVPAPLVKHTTSFPTKEALSLTNAQVLMSVISVSYEPWPVAREILNGWGEGSQKASWVAGYHVESVSWRDDSSTRGLPGQTRSVDLAIRVLIAKIGENSVIVTFQGTDPFSLADWNTDWDLYSNEEVGKYGRIHPGFRVALGLNRDLQPLENIRTRYEVTEDGDAVPSEQPMSLFSLLQSRLQTVVQGDPTAEVFVIGHSLGGALAAIFSRTLTLNEADSGASSPLSVAPQVKALYTIGQPRFGDFKFVTGVEQALHSTPDKPTYIRIVNINDIVPAMPPPGSQDLGPTSFQHSGFLMYISLFGRVMPQKEQPIITFARAVIVAALTAFQSLGLWLAHWVPSIAPGVHTRVPFLMVATRFAALATFLPIGIVQHIPANYHQALLASRPADWRADIDKNAAANHVLADFKQSMGSMAHNYYTAARKAVRARTR